jgi:membrane-associated protease RseP (regulator of RpoE activity)
MSGSPQQADSYLDSLHPGIVLRGEADHFVVAKVLPESPAVAAGLRAEDEITRINGRSILDSTVENQWSFAGNPMTFLTVRRGGIEKVVPVKLVPLRQLVENVWLRDSIKSAAFTPGLCASAAQPVSTFTLGIRTVRTRGRLVVSAILEGGSGKPC